MGKELELKLTLTDPSQEDRLLADPRVFDGDYETVVLRADYYDVPSLALTREKISLRLRRENDRLVATAKAGGGVKDGLHRREEYNLEVSESRMDPAWFPELALRVLPMIRDERLEVIIRTEMNRRRRSLSWGESRIELALDHGFVEAAGKREEVLELEIELLRGKSADLFSFREQCLGGYRLVPEDESKFSRGLRLLTEAGAPR